MHTTKGPIVVSEFWIEFWTWTHATQAPSNVILLAYTKVFKRLTAGDTASHPDQYDA